MKVEITTIGKLARNLRNRTDTSEYRQLQDFIQAYGLAVKRMCGNEEEAWTRRFMSYLNEDVNYLVHEKFGIATWLHYEFTEAEYDAGKNMIRLKLRIEERHVR